ncbi:MAG: nitrous oxide-stimulated promoter family protein [Alistipes ihumii]|uniref:nitrous oxide-stimulated promoter family protein n=1 Tax=Alistipes ihumii TaxID=1470347 RepID=UPI0027B8999F|nr:nitrous oxide-stimulated promoter family protein [Alistipes ihumii]
MPVDRKKPSRSRIDREKRTVEYMVGLYCRKKEGYPIPCAECAALIRYAHDRLDRCAFGEAKTSCRRCPIHCYRPAMREKMRRVMRFSGPRMLLYSPRRAIAHWLGEIFGR